MTDRTFTPADDVAAIMGMFGRELKHSAQPFTLLVSFLVREGSEDGIVREFEAARECTLGDRGCLAFELNRQADGGRFVVHEKWQSLADLEAHLRTPHALRLRRACDAAIVGMPEFDVLVPAAARRTSFGNHAAIRVRRTDREAIRNFYAGVLGCKLVRELDDKDDFRMGDGFYIAFLYASGSGLEADQGVPYAAADVLSDQDFLKAMFLELRSDDVEELRRRIIASGVRVLEVPDIHLYFQAPGGQVWRLVGGNEDLSKYEGHTTSADP